MIDEVLMLYMCTYDTRACIYTHTHGEGRREGRRESDHVHRYICIHASRRRQRWMRERDEREGVRGRESYTEREACPDPQSL